MTCRRAAHQVTLQKLYPNQMSVHNATSKGNSWSCSAAWCLGQVVHRRDHQSPFPGNPFMTWENQPHFSKVILFYIPDITQIIIKYPQYLPYIPHTVFPKYIWKMHITPKYPRKISTKNTRNKDKTANAVYICLYLSISIYIYLYLCLSISVYICLYLSISIYIYLYLSMSIYIYLYIYLDLSISISMYLHLSPCISIYLYLYLSLAISIYLYLFLSISIYLYLPKSIYIYLYLSISIYIYLYLSIS